MVPAQIRYFLILYDELNFTRAAKRCGVSQPSLTNGIKDLESRFGGKLFDRVSSSQSQTRPTDLAVALKPHFKRMIDSALQAERIADQFLKEKPESAKKLPEAAPS
jgi:DNA-binding transcriptional LysR family regulator